jgi:hypothetical protein
VEGGVAEVGTGDVARALVLNAAMQRMERLFMIFIILEFFIDNFQEWELGVSVHFLSAMGCRGHFASAEFPKRRGATMQAPRK